MTRTPAEELTEAVLLLSRAIRRMGPAARLHSIRVIGGESAFQIKKAVLTTGDPDGSRTPPDGKPRPPNELFTVYGIPILSQVDSRK